MDLMALIASVAGALLSLLFAYVPGAKGWFEGLKGGQKRLVMLGCLVVTALALVGLACGGLAADFGLKVTCDRPGIVAVIEAFVMAVMGNQATFLISPKGGTAKVEPVYEDLV